MNINMNIVISAFVISWYANTANPADYKSADFSLNNIPKLQVRIGDNATGGCWTSMSAAQTNLRDKLELLGVAIAETSPYRALVEVRSSRLNDRIVFRRRIPGGCFGSARIMIYKKEEPIDENTPIDVLLIMDTTFKGYDNANNLVFSMIDELIASLKSKGN